MCTAVSEVEHAVCTVSAGPRSPSLYATRVVRKSWRCPMIRASGSTPSGPPPALVPSAPAYTPIHPGNRAGSMPASSIASAAHSRNTRCCGSMVAASARLYPKNDQSKLRDPARTPRAGT